MTQNLDEYFKSLNLNCTPTGIKTLEEQRAINANGVQMITIKKPSSEIEKSSKIKNQEINSKS